MGVRDIEAKELINAVAEKLRSMKELEPPVWSKFIKTGSHRQRTPDNTDWWLVRSASLLRKIYFYGPVGTNRLRTVYGGGKNRGTKPRRHRKASGAVLRKMLHQLEAAGFIKFVDKPKKGRIVTAKGQKFLDAAAKECAKKG